MSMPKTTAEEPLYLRQSLTDEARRFPPLWGNDADVNADPDIRYWAISSGGHKIVKILAKNGVDFNATPSR